jgi:hypothetical protein
MLPHSRAAFARSRIARKARPRSRATRNSFRTKKERASAQDASPYADWEKGGKPQSAPPFYRLGAPTYRERIAMIQDFKGHHFVEDSKQGEPPGPHHCDRCRLKASLRPDGSVFFDIQGNGVFLKTSTTAPFNTSRVPACKDWSVVRPHPA